MRSQQPYRFPFAKYPAVRLAILLATGIMLAGVIPMRAFIWPVILGIVAAGWGISEYLSQKRLRPAFTYGAIGFYSCVIVAFGAFWYSFRTPEKWQNAEKLLSAYQWDPIEATGTIQNISKNSSGKYRLDVAVNSTVFEDSLRWNHHYKLRVLYQPNQKGSPKTLRLGATIRFKATVYPLRDKRNPHGFDYKKYLTSQGIAGQAGITKIYHITPNKNWLSWNWWRQRTLDAIEHNFSPNTIPLAKALLIGYKNELRPGVQTAFARAGLAHIMAVSGLHVGFIIAPFWLIIPLLWSLKWGKHLGLFFFCLVLFFYAGLTGFPASVVRASITGGLLTYGRLFYKVRDPKNLTAVAAIIILLVDPSQLFDVGFQLSFSAVYIILLVLPVLQQYVPGRLQHRWYGTPLMIILVSFIVQLGLYPLLSFYFGQFSLIGPLANAFVVPCLALIIPYALALLPLAGLFPSVIYVMNAPARAFLHVLHGFVMTIVSWNWSWIHTQSPGPLVFLIWLAVILLIAASTFAKIRWKMAILCLVLLCTQQVIHLYHTLQTPKLKITMLDVGQGDATLVTTPSGKHFMIDTGRWTPDYNSAKYVILPHLKALGIKKLDAIFLSHPHADHIGGMPALINAMPIDTIYNSGSRYDSKLYHRYLKDAARHHIPVKSLHAGAIVPIDKHLRMYIYGPSSENHNTDVNEHSLIEELVYGKEQFLFMGDAGHAEEHELLKHFGKLIDTDFLKVGHHGSKTSSSVLFLNVATPDISAVSLAMHNRFHFPNVQAVRHLRHTKTKLYFTSRRGALEFVSDGKSIAYHNWH